MSLRENCDDMPTNDVYVIPANGTVMILTAFLNSSQSLLHLLAIRAVASGGVTTPNNFSQSANKASKGWSRINLQSTNLELWVCRLQNVSCFSALKICRVVYYQLMKFLRRVINN